MARPDPHSFRDDTQPAVEHLSWDVRADFSARTLDAVLAQECFERNRGRYHPIAITVIGARLSQADGSG